MDSENDNDNESLRSETEELEREFEYGLNPNEYYPPGHENRINELRSEMHKEIRSLPRHKSRKTIFARLLHSRGKKARKSERQLMNGVNTKESNDFGDGYGDADIEDEFDDDYPIYEFDNGMATYDEKEMDLLGMNGANNQAKKAQKEMNGQRMSYHNPLHHSKLFKRSGYQIDRRLSSGECIESQYRTECTKRRNRRRSKSDPNWLAHTNSWQRKVEYEYRANNINLFAMMGNKRSKSQKKPLMSKRQKMSKLYANIFGDSDFDTNDELSDEAFEESMSFSSLLRDLDRNYAESEIDENESEQKSISTEEKTKSETVPQSIKEEVANQKSNTFVAPLKTTNSHSSVQKLSKSNNGTPVMSSHKSQPMHGTPVNNSVKLGNKLRSLSTLNLGSSDSHPASPKVYGGHVYASREMIEEEFGDGFKPMYQFNVKKRDKVKRFKNRILVLDINMQVIRVKDATGKTHKEHIVSSIKKLSNVVDKTHKEAPAQLVIEFHDNRDYHLTFENEKFKQEFENLTKKLINFQAKLASKHSKKMLFDATPGDSDLDLIPATAMMGGVSSIDNHGLSMTEAQFNALLNSGRAFSGDGDPYTGQKTENVVYQIVKINRWGQKRIRTMIIHLIDKMVRLFDDKRKCRSEYTVGIMQILDILDNRSIEVTFKSDQKPTKFIFRSYIDMWHFIDQMRSINDNIMINNSQNSNKNAKIGTLKAKKTEIGLDTNHVTPQQSQNNSDEELDEHENNAKIENLLNSETFGLQDEYETNEMVLRYSVIRLIRSKKKMVNDDGITWRQYRRVIYLDLNSNTIRMITLGLHSKDYAFVDVILLEKSYVNANQLHISVKDKNKMKDYWYEFLSPQAREEFVGRLIQQLPGTLRHSMPNQSVRISNTSNNGGKKTLGTIHDTRRFSSTDYERGSLLDSASPILSSTLAHNDSSSNNNNNGSAKKAPRLLTDKAFDHHSNKSKRNSGSKAKGNNNENESKELPTLTNNSSWKRHLSVTDVELYDKEETKSSYMTEDPVSLFVGSWNVGESEVNYANLKNWIVNGKEELYDIYVIGLQECASNLRKDWMKAFLKLIDSGRNEYVLFHKVFLMGIACIMIVHERHIAKISHLESQVVPTGHGNILGNKGAVAISFQFQETTFCFINCHLAARAERFEKRAQNYYRIVKSLQLGRGHLDVLSQFSHVFWFGDLNYRIEMDFYKAVNLLKTKKYAELCNYDQLRHVIDNKQVFFEFKEGRINFAPTYRWERNKNTVSNKREQPPSYCDRILYKSLPESHDLWQEYYLSSTKCFGSDHRPVCALFKFRPRMPYFTLSSHFTNDLTDPNNRNSNIKDIKINLLDLEANFGPLLEIEQKDDSATTDGVINKKDQRESRNVSTVSSMSNDANSGNNSKKQILSFEDEIDIYLHYNYAAKIRKVKGGKYIKSIDSWEWPEKLLESNCIRPFIPDAEFLSRTHVTISFVNVNKTNLGSCVISLFHAFPESLVDSKKILKDYENYSKQMLHLMNESAEYHRDRSGFEQKQNNGKRPTNFIENAPLTYGKHSKNNPKPFEAPILRHGKQVGTLKGFIQGTATVLSNDLVKKK